MQINTLQLKYCDNPLPDVLTGFPNGLLLNKGVGQITYLYIQNMMIKTSCRYFFGKCILIRSYSVREQMEKKQFEQACLVQKHSLLLTTKSIICPDCGESKLVTEERSIYKTSQ